MRLPTTLLIGTVAVAFSGCTLNYGNHCQRPIINGLQQTVVGAGQTVSRLVGCSSCGQVKSCGCQSQRPSLLGKIRGQASTCGCNQTDSQGIAGVSGVYRDATGYGNASLGNASLGNSIVAAEPLQSAGCGCGQTSQVIIGDPMSDCGCGSTLPASPQVYETVPTQAPLQENQVPFEAPETLPAEFSENAQNETPVQSPTPAEQPTNQAPEVAESEIQDSLSDDIVESFESDDFIDHTEQAEEVALAPSLPVEDEPIDPEAFGVSVSADIAATRIARSEKVYYYDGREQTALAQTTPAPAIASAPTEAPKPDKIVLQARPIPNTSFFNKLKQAPVNQAQVNSSQYYHNQLKTEQELKDLSQLATQPLFAPLPGQAPRMVSLESVPQIVLPSIATVPGLLVIERSPESKGPVFHGSSTPVLQASSKRSAISNAKSMTRTARPPILRLRAFTSDAQAGDQPPIVNINTDVEPRRIIYPNDNKSNVPHTRDFDTDAPLQMNPVDQLPTLDGQQYLDFPNIDKTTQNVPNRPRLDVDRLKSNIKNLSERSEARIIDR